MARFLLLSASLCTLSVGAVRVHFGIYDRESHPGGSWNLLSLKQLNDNKADFIKQYNSGGGVNVIKTFKAKNCCFALESGKMLKVAGSPYGYQFPAGISGGIKCSPSHGYSGLLHLYRTPQLAKNVRFEETAACELNHNPAFWMRYDHSAFSAEFGLAPVNGNWKLAGLAKKGWKLADLKTLLHHKADFQAAYRKTGGLKTLTSFVSENCCIAVGKEGKMLHLGGPGLPNRAYLSQGGAMKCNIKFDGTYKLIDEDSVVHSQLRDSFYARKACTLEGNPAIYYRQILKKPVKVPTPAPTVKKVVAGCTCKLTAWSTWSTCSKPCGGGIHNRLRESNKCASCKAPLAQTKACNTHQCVAADIKDSSPGIFATMKFRNMKTSSFLEKHSFFTKFLTNSLGWYPGWIRITKIKHDVSTFCDRVEVSGLDRKHEQGDRMGDFHLVDNYQSGGKSVYKNGKDYIYYFPSKGYWLIGPDVGSEKAGIIGQIKNSDENANPPVSVKHWYVFESKSSKWVRNQIKVTCHSSPRTDVQFQIAAPNCDAATMKQVPTMGDIAAAIPAMQAQLEELKFPVTSISIVKTRVQGCEPRIKLTMQQPAAAKLIKSSCKFNKVTNKLELTHSGPETKFNCFHKLDQDSKKWQCFCHSWHEKAVAVTPSPTPKPLAKQLQAVQKHNAAKVVEQKKSPKKSKFGKWIMQDGWWKMNYKAAAP